MWIMLTKKLPIEKSPPKLSFHWAEPWPMIEWAVKQERAVRSGKIIVLGDGTLGSSVFNKEPDFRYAVGIIFQSEKLRVFPHEFSKAASSLRELVNGGGVIFHPSETVAALAQTLSVAKQAIKDAAMLDGCDEFQAEMVAYGKDPFEAELPPSGWYEVKPELASVFCYDTEMEWKE